MPPGFLAEAARVLRPDDRLAIADIVTERPLTEGIAGNADLCASCIGGAAHEDTYREIIEAAGLGVTRRAVQPVPIPLAAGPRGQQHVRREEHLPAGGQTGRVTPFIGSPA